MSFNGNLQKALLDALQETKKNNNKQKENFYFLKYR